MSAELGVTEYFDDLALCKGNPSPAYSWIRWRAGKVVSEFRSYRGTYMTTAFHGSVPLFRLLGYGETKEEAIEMAKHNARR